MPASDRFMLLMMTIGILTLLGLLVIFWLLILWRRFNERQSRLARRPRSVTETDDLWQASAQRLASPALEDGQADDPPSPEQPPHDERS